MTQAAQATPNTLFPGRPDYVGSKTGWFGLLHHTMLYEYSHDVMERVEYVKNHKPRHEVATRLHNMLYLPVEFVDKLDAIYAAYNAKLDALFDEVEDEQTALDDDYAIKCAVFDADYGALYAELYAKQNKIAADCRDKRLALRDEDAANRAALDAEIRAYIRHHIPDCAWDEINETLIFPEA